MAFQQFKGPGELKLSGNIAEEWKTFRQKFEIFMRASKGYKEEEEDEEFDCSKCGYRHGKRSCPAFNKKCLNCQELNHFAKMCRPQRRVHELELEDSSEDEHNSELYISAVSRYVSSVSFNETARPKQWIEEVSVGKSKVKFKIDTGAEVSVMPLDLFEQLKSKIKVERPSAVLVNFGNFKIKPRGKVILCCKVGKMFKPIEVEFMLTEANWKPILGLDESLRLGLIQKIPINEINLHLGSRDEVLQENKEVFSGIGCMPGTYKITLDPDIEPVIQAPRKIPISLQSKLKSKLESLVASNIIERVI